MHVVEIKSTIYAFNASIKCSPVALFLLFHSNPLRWALNGAWVFFKKLNEVSCFQGTSVNLLRFFRLVEISGIEPLTSCLQGRRSPSWAKPPYPSGQWIADSEQFSNCQLSTINFQLFEKWWAKMDSNHRPHDYQSCALASWAIGPYWISSLLIKNGGD